MSRKTPIKRKKYKHFLRDDDEGQKSQEKKYPTLEKILLLCKSLLCSKHLIIFFGNELYQEK